MRSSWKGVGAGLLFMLATGAAAVTPAMAQDKLEQDFGVIPALRRRRLASLLGHAARCRSMKSRSHEKMGQLPKAYLEKLLDVMAGSSLKICKDQTDALCAAARL